VGAEREGAMIITFLFSHVAMHQNSPYQTRAHA